MYKNDRLIAIAGVVVLIIASIGVFTWQADDVGVKIASIHQFYSVVSKFDNEPMAISVCDSSPFYALIATPLAIHYDSDGMQYVKPLLVRNITEPSRAVTRAFDQIGYNIDLYLDGSVSPEECSVDVADTYWISSEAVLLIPNTEEGYALGVLATPIASYLSIPIIIADEINQSVVQVLSELNVKKSIVIGETLNGYGEVLRLTCVEDIVDASIDLVREKFGDIDYISITNPIDAWDPEVLDSVDFSFDKTMTTGATTEIISTITNKGSNLIGTFIIPDDYKYALVKFTGINEEVDNVDLLGDYIHFMCGPMLDDEPRGLQTSELHAGGTDSGGIPIRDAQGNIIADLTYDEAVLYDRGGVEYKITAGPSWLATDTGKVRVEIEIEKLSDPYYCMMKGISSMAPYLTAYRKGILFGKSEFAFAADDDVLYYGKPSPGHYMPRRNPRLTWASNDRLFEIHDQINDLLAKLAGIEVYDARDIEDLTNYYKNNPVYISLIGGATGIPQFTYDSSIDPVQPFDKVAYYFGGGVPSDFIYGNVDPNPGDWTSQAPDLFSDTGYPYQENIVGRITGWDAQDASALIARTVFYDDIIDDLEDWKDNAIIQMGGGNDFQKPFVRYKIFGEILQTIKRGEPMKMETGASYFNGLAIQNLLETVLDFDTGYIRENEAAYQGFTDEALDILKKANALNRVLMSKRQIRNSLGTGVVIGRESQENSNFILANAHGNQHTFGMGDVGLYKLGLGLQNGFLERLMAQVATIMGFGPGLSLSSHGYYSTRNVENMNLGPSFLWIESCICGKIDGLYPKQGISQAYIHSGCNAVIASTTSSNIAGGYLEPKKTKYDFPGQVRLRYLQWQQKARRGVYPDLHFGFLMYEDLIKALHNEGTSIGYALREARNSYLPKDADWEVWWSPPLRFTGIPELDRFYNQELSAGSNPEGLDVRMDNKFMSFQEYTLYGDPAFVPYIPIH
jgi:hypothetical protein